MNLKSLILKKRELINKYAAAEYRSRYIIGNPKTGKYYTQVSVINASCSYPLNPAG